MSLLVGLDVIILRSPQKDDPLTKAIFALGGRAHQLSVQRIEPQAEDNLGIEKLIRTIGTYDKAIFVSKNAVLLALRWLDRCQTTLRSKDQCFAVGPSSAALLEMRQIQVQYPPEDWNSEGLLALPALVDVRGQNIVIFRGLGGRPLLGEALSERGALVEYCELYQRLPEQSFGGEILGLLNPEHASVLVALSGGVLDHLLVVAEKQHQGLILKTPVIVPGARVQSYALELGFEKVIVAAGVMAKDMEAAIVDWYTQSSKNTS